MHQLWNVEVRISVKMFKLIFSEYTSRIAAREFVT